MDLGAIIVSEVPLQTGSFDVHVQPVLAHPQSHTLVPYGKGGDKKGGTFKLIPSPAASGPLEMHLEIFFFPRVYHPTGCKGPCPLRNVKSNPEKSRHLPRKGEGRGASDIRTRPFPAGGFFHL